MKMGKKPDKPIKIKFIKSDQSRLDETVDRLFVNARNHGKRTKKH